MSTFSMTLWKMNYFYNILIINKLQKTIITVHIRPRALYGFESWILTKKKKDEKKLESFEMCCFRMLRVRWKEKERI